MRTIGTLIKSLPTNIKFIIIIILVMVGMWMMITPFYNVILETFEFTPWASVVIGAIIVWFGVKKWRLHPW